VHKPANCMVINLHTHQDQYMILLKKDRSYYTYMFMCVCKISVAVVLKTSITPHMFFLTNFIINQCTTYNIHICILNTSITQRYLGADPVVKMQHGRPRD